MVMLITKMFLKKKAVNFFHSHTVNILSALPLTCLDVLLSVSVDRANHMCEGVNMDCVHAMLLLMDRRLNRASVYKLLYRGGIII